jgi:hypothetical protein
MSRKQSMDFRKAEVSYVMQRWKGAESCSLVGIGSVGKSNLIQHLSDPEVQGHYLQGMQTDYFKAILIDSNMLGPLPSDGSNTEQFRCWAGYELMMHRLFLAFYPFDILGSVEAQRFYETYQALQDGSNPLYAYMGLRYFELGLEFFLRRGAQIVFMFDEFEEMLRHLPVKFFQTLRGLRDTHKSQISYLTFSRLPLPSLVEKYNISLLDIEPFIELFTDNLYYVGPYSDADARDMVERLMRRSGTPYPESVVQYLLDITGRYAGLLRAGFHALSTYDKQPITPQNYEAILDFLGTRPAVRSECRTIWMSLNSGERYVLKAVARLTPYNVTTETEQAVTMLVQKRLLYLNRSQQLEIYPPVFKTFILKNAQLD